MSERGATVEKAERRAALKRIGAYHERERLRLVEHVRDAMARLDAGEVDVFEFDDLVHRYHQASQKLWRFCVVDGIRIRGTVAAIDAGETPDWWELAAPRRR